MRNCLAFDYWKLSIKSQLSYKKDFVTELIIWFFYSCIPFFALMLMLQKYSIIGNLSIEQIAVLYGISQMSYDIARMVGRGFDNFSDLVMSGDFDLYYIRPMTILYQVMFSDIFLRRLAGIFQGLLLLIYGIHKMRLFSFKNLSLIFLILAAAVLMYLSLFIINASIVLITVKENVFLSYFLDLASQTGYYPLKFLKNPIKFILTYLIPIGICIYYPLLAIFENEAILIRMIPSLIVSVSLMLGALLLFEFCRKYYRSVNN